MRILKITFACIIFSMCALILESCVEGVDEEVLLIEEKDALTRAPTGGSASCLFSGCTVTCPDGNIVSTGCSWGFAYCNCDAPGSQATVSNNNLNFIGEYQEFLINNEFEPEILQLVNNLSEIINNEIWEEYGAVVENYNNSMESLPMEQQELAIEFIESNQ